MPQVECRASCVVCRVVHRVSYCEFRVALRVSCLVVFPASHFVGDLHCRDGDLAVAGGAVSLSVICVRRGWSCVMAVFFELL